MPHRLGLLLLTVLTTLTPPTVAADPASPVELLIATNRTLVIGHRGFPAAAPENTLPSFRLALAAGADLVELDYQPAADGIPVVLHDYDLDRTTDAKTRWHTNKIRLSTRTAAQVQTLDAGKWFHAQYAGTRLPTLTEALDFIQKEGVTLIERKGGDPEHLVKLLDARNLLNQVVVQSFDWAFISNYHRLEPRQVLGALGPPGSINGRKLTDAERTLSPDWVGQVLRTGARVLVWNQLVTRSAVADAHRRGLKVWVYTINDPVLANSLIELDVDGLITDNPARMWRALALRTAPPASCP